MQHTKRKPPIRSKQQSYPTYYRDSTPTFRSTNRTDSRTFVNDVGSVSVMEDFNGTYGVGEHRVPATMSTTQHTSPNGEVNADTLIFIPDGVNGSRIRVAGGKRHGSNYTPGIRVENPEEPSLRSLVKKIPFIGQFFSNGGTVKKIKYFK